MVTPARRDGRRRTAAGLLVAAAGWACSGAPPATMVGVPPPAAWTETVPYERGRRDAWFRESIDSPLLAEERPAFTGLAYFDLAPEYYFLGPLNEYAEKKRFTITTTAGQPRPCERVGWLAFPIRAAEQRLQVYRLLDEGGSGTLFLPFMDATSGQETYPAGRYVDLEGPEGGPYVLDFNKAYNPMCAYGAPERFACPETPSENRLAVRIEAGERGWKGGPARASG
jgi:hypothetical protein